MNIWVTASCRVHLRNALLGQWTSAYFCLIRCYLSLKLLSQQLRDLRNLPIFTLFAHCNKCRIVTYSNITCHILACHMSHTHISHFHMLQVTYLQYVTYSHETYSHVTYSHVTYSHVICHILTCDHDLHPIFRDVNSIPCVESSWESSLTHPWQIFK